MLWSKARGLETERIAGDRDRWCCRQGEQLAPPCSQAVMEGGHRDARHEAAVLVSWEELGHGEGGPCWWLLGGRVPECRRMGDSAAERARIGI